MNIVQQVEQFAAKLGTAATVDHSRVAHGAITVTVRAETEEDWERVVKAYGLPSSDSMHIDHTDEGAYTSFVVTYLFN